MKVIYANNPDHALACGLAELVKDSVRVDSRNGPVLRFKTPVTTVWTNPSNRVSFNPVRDSNPFFSMIESLWMLAGRNDVATIGYYAKQLIEYTDDGQTLNGAYGYRWCNYFGYNQLDAIVAELKKNPQSRRCVLSMWNASREFYAGEDSWAVKREADLLNQGSRDLPCNLQVLFDLSLGQLDMTVTNRSNDMIWGCYGANAVHFAFLQEYVANRIGCKIGTYYQMSNNLHVYLDFPITKRFLTYEHGSQDIDLDIDSVNYDGHYANHKVTSCSLEAYSPYFENELQRFVDNCRSYTLESAHRFENLFLNNVALPMALSYNEYKKGNTIEARDYLCNELVRTRIVADSFGPRPHVIYNDWLMAGVDWIDRRIDKNKAPALKAD